jgi:hypothetical protein
MQGITTVGLDIAKSVFQVHGVDAQGEVIIRRQLKRRFVLAFFQKLPPCLVGIEACASSHHWSREIKALGHTVRLMPPAYVKPYVKRQKNDAADAEAICEAVTRANMRFVATKTPEQQSCLDLMDFLNQRDGDYCIGSISSRWFVTGMKVCGAGGRYPSAECGLIVGTIMIFGGSALIEMVLHAKKAAGVGAPGRAVTVVRPVARRRAGSNRGAAPGLRRRFRTHA